MRKTKFYAVKNGRQTGVFTTWEECQKQTSGHRNATFKSFSTREEAEMYVKGERTLKVADQCSIFTDGSHQRAEDYLGIGAWCRYEDESYELSMKVDRVLLDSYGVPKESACSNPTAELVAFTEVLRRFKGRELLKPVVFFSDFIGVKNWMEGSWKATEPHIVAILREAKLLKETIKGDINIEWVKGHSGNEANEQADRLAGSHDEIDTFAKLVELISK